VPHHNGVSWQGHLCGAIAGVIAAWLLRRERTKTRAQDPGSGRPVLRSLAK
jgi:membrane associated rhomboid family serine protease